MAKQNIQFRRLRLLTPVVGALAFIILYVLATRYYPGGSQTDKHSIGFSWVNNYWCNLLGSTGINGEYNSAKPLAIAAMFVLCITLGFFWFQFLAFSPISRIFKLITQISGLISTAVSFLLFSNLSHDLIINLACGLGLIAMSGVFIGLFKMRWHGLFMFGLFNLLLVIANNYLYYTNGLIIYLPLIQKITFAAFLLWMSMISLRIFKESTHRVK